MVSNREQLHWQFRAVRVLEKLLKTAGRDDLPAITWTVGNAGAVLVGRCYGRRDVDRRTEWEAWRSTLGAAAWPERTDGGGVTHLHAVAKDVDGLVDVVVIADVFPENEDTEGSQ
jgi:hypothetical protein